MNVRDLELEWLNDDDAPDVPPPVRAMWFLSSVALDWRRGFGREVRHAIGSGGDTVDVAVVLERFVTIGSIAGTLREAMDE